MTNVVQTVFGSVSGIEDGSVVKFLGIPYAKPPVGELRFREPRLIEPWDGVLSATKFAKDPMQRNAKLDTSHYSEDCLYLNVWVPEHGEEKLPVMVWIPGGAYSTGGSGAADPNGPSLYECATMARDTGCIIVSVSYRLNVFGFLNFSKYSSRFEDNLGMKDLITALKWVNQAIGAFGGDADNVTLFGESAGAGAISALIMVEEAKPLFHKAIIQSNCIGSFYTPEEEEDVCTKYLEYVGLDASRVEGLLELPYPVLMEATEKLTAYVLAQYFGKCAFCPVVDGTFITDYPTLATFEGLDKPVLVGSNRNEGNFLVFSYKMADGESEKLSALMLRRLMPERRKAILAEYPLPGKQGLADVMTDTMYTMPKLRFAERLSRQGNVYVYRYDYVAPVMRLMGLKACHVAEMIPLFDLKVKPYVTFGMGARGRLQKIGLRMRRYWGAFAREGVPSVSGQVEWKPYDEQDRFTMVIGKTDSLVADADHEVRIRYEGIERFLI